MNEHNEIGGDLQDEYAALQAAEADEEAPELPEWTDEELDDFESRHNDPEGLYRADDHDMPLEDFGVAY